MPSEVHRFEFDRRDARGVETELGHRGVEDLPVQNIQPLERPPPASHLLHRPPLEPSPGWRGGWRTPPPHAQKPLYQSTTVPKVSNTSARTPSNAMLQTPRTAS